MSMGEPLSPYKASLSGDYLGTGGLPEANSYLEQQNEAHFLANLLADEKKRCQQHKDNYTTLKEDHRKLKHELLSCQEDVIRLTQDKDNLHGRQAQQLATYDAQISALRQTISELQGQLPGREKIDALKSQMISDVEGPFRSRIDNLQADNESLRADNAKLKHDFAFLKTEYEHSLSRQRNTLDDLKLQHQAEVGNLSKDKDELIRRLHQDSSGDMQRMHTIQKENTTLNQRVKSLLGELEEIRNQREKVGLESDHVQRLQNKQLTEFQANFRGLEVEKDSLKKQVNSQSKEISQLLDSQTDLTKRLFEEEQRASTLRNQLESARHESSLSLTQGKLEAVKQQGLVERERDSLRSQVEDLKCRLEAQQSALAQLESSVRETERQCADKISSIREEEFSKLSEANHDRQSLEGRVHTLEREKVDLEERLHQETNRHEQQLRDQSSIREQLEKELITVRAKVNNQSTAHSELDFERNRSNEQRTQLMKLEAENMALRNTETELTELINSLRHKVKCVNEEIRRVTERERANNTQAEKVLAQHKSVWSDEKGELRRRIEHLELKMKESLDKLSMETATYSKKKQVYQKLVEKLRRKLELSEAEKQELSLQVESVRGYIPPEIVQNIKKELKDLKNKHKEYKHIMLAGDISHVPIGTMSFATANVHNAPFDISPSHSPDLAELTGLMERMDTLEAQQKKQLTGFGLLSPRSNTSLESEDQ